MTTTQRPQDGSGPAVQTLPTAPAAPGDGPSPWVLEDRTRGSAGPDRLAADVRSGLSATPPSLPPKWFYDEVGSLLFDDITRLPEYYPTRTEEQILLGCAEEVAALTGAETLVELGAGYSRKTRALLEALTAGGRPLLFVPLDVAEQALRDTAARVLAAHPTVAVQALVADFGDELHPLPGTPGSRLVLFLGSTIGNLLPEERVAFFGRLHRALAPGDCLLLGADLVKDVDRLVAAYDDGAGVTAAFNKNVLRVLARELSADIDLDAVDHVALWNAEDERIEMRLRARRDLTLHFPSLDLTWTLPQGQDLLTETSAKFRLEGLRRELTDAGLEVLRVFTDDAEDFSLSLARRT